jgi:hypothetical protein
LYSSKSSYSTVPYRSGIRLHEPTSHPERSSVPARWTANS